MARLDRSCAICAATERLTGILVGDNPMFLCSVHAAKLGDGVARAFDDWNALFAASELDRREQPERRTSERRMFPPRPELRRHNQGRRAGDPKA